MTTTIIITAIFVMTLFNLLLNIEGCYYTNIPELKIKNKELFIYFLLLYKNTLLKTRFNLRNFLLHFLPLGGDRGGFK